ncbi:AsmA-like C-terminal region-containing protein [Dinghuibacter silviterrae]|uniref:AsmA-like protein n=1 Tax=Dinghuibacter silviterrae TaxID=1539049 RepID=A0A4R8DVR3_9BACT|nr:AsmA-like C-terminal region-containing protein [Dinghuibacter silviterrae]TDX02136.1 AsmA-like protein [Dinghuibacter silviterrae]
MSTKLRKRLIRLLLIPLLSLLALVGLAIILLLSQQQRLVKLAVKELNKQLPSGDLAVGGSDIAVFQNFPYISIALSDVRLYLGKRETDSPIVKVERVYLGFSLPDILRQHYRVKALGLKNGFVHLLQDRQGNLNIIEAMRMPVDSTGAKDTTTSGALDLDVKKFVLKNMDVTYLDSASRQHLSSHIDRVQASCRLDSGKVFAGLEGGLVFDYTRPGAALFLHKHLSTTLEMSYDQETKFLRLPVGKLRFEDASFNITGTADLQHGDSLDIHIKGDKDDFKQLLAFAPEQVVHELKPFRYDGRISFDATINGPLQGGRLPLINLTFACADAWVHNTKAGRHLDSVSFKGYYTNGPGHSLKTSELRLTDMTARPDKGVFKGNFIMRDFTDPKVLMQVNSELEIGFIGAFLGIKDLERISGHITLKMDFNELVDISAPQQSLSQLTQGIQSELTVRDLAFRIPGYARPVEHLNLHAQMKNGFVTLDSLSGKIGRSDIHLMGSLSDLPALFHQRQQPVALHCTASSSTLAIKDLLDTTKTGHWVDEEVYGLTIALSLQTSVDQLLHPSPLPKGRFTLDSLNASFKKYPHAFHDFGADLTINDTALFLRNFGGMIDSSDLRFNGRVVNYALWFEKVKKGKTQLAFDLKSRRLAMRDLLGKRSSQFVPPDYRQETGSNIWLRSKIDLRYDSVFQFADAKIAHISGALQRHDFTLDSIRGNVKFGIDDYIKIDTLQGRVGNSDFNLSMRIYNGKDTIRRKKENYLQFASRFLDVDQLSNYRLTEADSTGTAAVSHDSAFTIFQIPFIDFNGSVNIGKIKYHKLGTKNLVARIRMQAGQQLYLDTLGMDIAGGRITARAHFNGSDPKKIYLRSRVNLQGVDLEKLLLKLDYLGQDYYINKNIKGTVDGQITSYVLVHPDFTPQIDQSEAQIAVEIHNGALINFAPMQAMSSYFRDKNLNMIRFDTLRNTLAFKNGALTIPDMNINSSLGYIEIAGRQSLDMQMEYDLRIPLKLVTDAGFSKLFGKKKEEVDPNQVDAIEYRDKEKRVHFINLKVTGTPDDFKVHLGKAKNS